MSWKRKVSKTIWLGGFFLRDSFWFGIRIEKRLSRNKFGILTTKLLDRHHSYVGEKCDFKSIVYSPHSFQLINVAHFTFEGPVCFHQGSTIGDTKRFDYKIGHAKGKLFIGTGAFVDNSITIGKNVIIGANAVVTKNVPENTIVIGVNKFITISESEMLVRKEWEFIEEFVEIK